MFSHSRKSTVVFVVSTNKYLYKNTHYFVDADLERVDDLFTISG